MTMQEQTLAGRTIAVPETRELDVFSAMLERRGATVLRCPLVAILDAPDPQPVLAWVRRFNTGEFHDLVLLTGEGLRRILRCIDLHGPDHRDAFTEIRGSEWHLLQHASGLQFHFAQRGRAVQSRALDEVSISIHQPLRERTAVVRPRSDDLERVADDPCVARRQRRYGDPGRQLGTVLPAAANRAPQRQQEHRGPRNRICIFQFAGG